MSKGLIGQAWVLIKTWFSFSCNVSSVVFKLKSFKFVESLAFDNDLTETY